MIDFVCSIPHYARHLRRFYASLPSSVQGEWYDAQDDPAGGDVAVVGAYRDMRWLRGRYRRLVLVEHGIGQSYAGTQADHPAYPGGRRDSYDLLLAPGPTVVDPAADRTVYVGSPVGEAGSPVVVLPSSDQPRFAVSFHWDCGIAPEAGTAFWEYLPHLNDQAERLGSPLIVHSHPRIWWDVYEQVAGQSNLEPCDDFDEVVERCSVYACDNSSTMYEFAALDRPVVVLNSQFWRRGVEHGKRFWEWADVGEQIAGGGQLADALLRAASDDPFADRRHVIVKECYVGDTAAGVDALVRLAA